MSQQYAVRADHEVRKYEVYEVATGKPVEIFTYRARSELSRGEAHGRANLARREWNENRRQG